MAVAEQSDVRVATQIAVDLVITRANGTVEVIGVKSYWHKNPLRAGAVQAIIERGEVITLEEIDASTTVSLLRRAATPKK